jgi:hypothetical protein
VYIAHTSPPPPPPQIRFFLLQNRQGKTRLSKWYVPTPDDAEKVKLENDINRVVAARSRNHTNFVEVRIRIRVGEIIIIRTLDALLLSWRVCS